MMARYLNWSYWFSSFAIPFTEQVAGYFLWLLIVIGAAGLAAKIIAWRTKTSPWSKLYKRVGNLFLFEAVLLGINFFFTQTSTPVLGSRWWFGLWILVGIIWVGLILRQAIWRLPKELKERKDQRVFEKYLPKKPKS